MADNKLSLLDWFDRISNYAAGVFILFMSLILLANLIHEIVSGIQRGRSMKTNPYKVVTKDCGCKDEQSN